ncbi:class I SAM-dependent methyltransferase [Bacillus carboniphilus]|uniref:Class I SAM-dependent methyltransferase n=1 Tax=Bacillus carboniphilus TaxID=86663 RepID=A0ABY9JZH7_9BACI|nr:class I SAM-dependent methyltransferase [Bacillus carboniphilus]WLR44183.1 class I SAM-dependent methyltransferase [Bacillus carboniphilus]
MKQSKVEDLYSKLNKGAEWICKKNDISYIEALTILADVLKGENEQESHFKELLELINPIHFDDYSKEEIRKSVQLVILKGQKEGTQPNHQMTPDAISIFMGYLVHKFVQVLENNKNVTVLDPVVGSGNLLTAVLNQLDVKTSYGIDIDEVLLKISMLNGNAQAHHLELFLQDSLMPFYIEPVDLVVADLPVGYYPNDENAATFELKSEQGHSYAHHLLIEQSLSYLKTDGYGFFIIPNQLFDSPEAHKLKTFLQKHAIVQGVIQLPLNVFKSEKYAKSIFILQKKGDETKAPKQAMLVNMPSFSDPSKVESVLGKIDQWIKENKII